MIVLGVDTVGADAGVALEGPVGLTIHRDLGERGRHAEALVPAVLELLERSGLDWTDLGAVAVNEGPGSFTGLRVGLAFSLGVSDALGIPVVGVGCLDILARACYDAKGLPAGGYVIGASDVRRGEVAMARFRIGDEGPIREEDDGLVVVKEAGVPPPPGTTVAGDGADLLWPTAAGLDRLVPTGGERARALCRLGREIARGGDVRRPQPRYARPPDARPRRST